MKWPYEENYEKWDGLSALCNEDAPSVGLLQSRKKCHSTFPLIQKLKKNIKWGWNICLGVIVSLEKFCWSSSIFSSISFICISQTESRCKYHFSFCTIIYKHRHKPTLTIWKKKRKKIMGKHTDSSKNCCLNFPKRLNFI